MLENNFIGAYATQPFVVAPNERMDFYSDGQYEILYVVQDNTIHYSLGTFYGHYTTPSIDLTYTRTYTVKSFGQNVYWDKGTDPFVMGMRDFSPVPFNKKTFAITSGPYLLTVDNIINSEITFSIPNGSTLAIQLPNATALKNSGLFEETGRFYDFTIINSTPGAAVPLGLGIQTPAQTVDGSTNLFGSNRIYANGLDGSIGLYSVGRISSSTSLPNYIYIRKN